MPGKTPFRRWIPLWLSARADGVQWRAARRLVERGARVDKLWHAAALGILSSIEEHFAGATQPTPEAVNNAFWQACHGGQREAAEYLLARGADLNWIPS